LITRINEVLKNDTIFFAEQLFRMYYSQNKDNMWVPSIPYREFSYIPFTRQDNDYMVRHISFDGYIELQEFLIKCAPRHFYMSTSLYSNPSIRPMENKNRFSQTLTFDIDAKNIDAAKEELYGLIDILKDTMGILDPNIKIFFSGNKGFHVYVNDPDYNGLGKEERKQISDYMLYKNVKIDSPITYDTSRLIRYPNSLHGSTGFRVRQLDPKEIDHFDPFYDATVFSGEITCLIYNRYKTIDANAAVYAILNGLVKKIRNARVDVI